MFYLVKLNFSISNLKISKISKNLSSMASFYVKIGKKTLLSFKVIRCTYRILTKYICPLFNIIIDK